MNLENRFIVWYKRLCDILNRLGMADQCDGQTDRQTDRQNRCYQ